MQTICTLYHDCIFVYASFQHHTFGTFGAILGFIGHLLCAFRVYGSVNERNIPREWTREAACLLFLICFLVIDIFMMLAHPQDMQQFFVSKCGIKSIIHCYIFNLQFRGNCYLKLVMKII